MTKLLEVVLKKLATLPADRQENIVRLILKEIVEHIENEPIKDHDSSSLPPSIGMGATRFHHSALNMNLRLRR
jgi:hypothetical protein